MTQVTFQIPNRPELRGLIRDLWRLYSIVNSYTRARARRRDGRVVNKNAKE